MTRLPRKPRINADRDVKVAYSIGRFGAATVSDIWPLFWTSAATARFGFGRLVVLGLVRSFRRTNPAERKWFSLTAEGAAWVIEQTGCDELELRTFSGLSRVNLDALSMRNRLWVSLARASAANSGARLELVRAEWELRRLKPADVSVVPDMLVVVAGQAERAFMVELDSGSQRRAVWEEKARAYRDLRQRGALFGEPLWHVVAIVPSARRARSVAAAVVAGGAGAFTYLGVAEQLFDGRGFGPHLWLAADLTQDPGAAPTAAFAGGSNNSDNPPQRPTTTVAVDFSGKSAS